MALPILGPVLNDFTTWSLQRGYPAVTVRDQLKNVLRLDNFFLDHNVKGLSDLTPNLFGAAWLYYHRLVPRVAGTVRQIERFLSEQGHLKSAPFQPKTPTDIELNSFSEYLCKLRGFEASTISSHVRYLKEFLNHIGYESRSNVWATLTLKDIENFLYCCSQRLNRYSLQQVVGIIRGFLRFQYEQGSLPRPFHNMIDTPRVYRLEQLPRSLPWETVRALLLSIDRSDPIGLRDYTLLFLVATYGLRSCEAVSITLDDIDWRKELIRISQRKTRNQLLLPLMDSVAETLIEYLKRGRPRLPFRQLFLRARAPHGPLKPASVSDIFQRWTDPSGLNIPFQGAHCIRHSFAVHLLRQGTPVKSIGDLLGHRTAESTCVYLRLATEDLRSVALPLPQGVAPHLNSTPQKKRFKPKADQKKATASPRKSNSLRSFLAEEINAYLQLKRSLGRGFVKETETLHSLDDFLATQPFSEDLTADRFTQWCKTLHGLSSTWRRRKMQIVRNFCLYRCRSKPQSYIPDALTFPHNHQPFPPYIISESEMVSILGATRYLRPGPRCPLRSETMRIALLLLYTTGIRREELLRLKWGDFDSEQTTLLIRATKFHKSRIIPLAASVAAEIKSFLSLRQKKRLPTDALSPLVWNGYHSPEGRSYTGTGLTANWHTLCTSLKIFTSKNKPPRLHDLRHSFAVNVLLRWYRTGENVQAKLPLLSTYLGHVSVVSTHYYLSFIEGLRSETSTRFHKNFGKVIIPIPPHPDASGLSQKSGGAS
jgi:site-specific recombinase XerD